MKTFNTSMAPVLRSIAFAVVAAALTLGATQLQAATGDELLMSSLPSAAMNKSVIEGDTLVAAVTKAVTENKSQAPEIVAAAIPKTRSTATQKAIVKAAIIALGDSKKLAPQIVYAAIKSSPSCGTSDGKGGYGKDGYSKDGGDNCKCASEYTKSAIEALGADPSEKLVDSIVSSAVQATDGKCAGPIANAASEAAPQYASSIADAAAHAGRGEDPNGTGAEDGIAFTPTGRPVPAPFVFPPATNGGGISSPTTPVN